MQTRAGQAIEPSNSHFDRECRCFPTADAKCRHAALETTLTKRVQ